MLLEKWYRLCHQRSCLHACPHFQCLHHWNFNGYKTTPDLSYPEENGRMLYPLKAWCFLINLFLLDLWSESSIVIASVEKALNKMHDFHLKLPPSTEVQICYLLHTAFNGKVSAGTSPIFKMRGSTHIYLVPKLTPTASACPVVYRRHNIG